MSRSYKKTPVCGYYKKESDKLGKQMINRRLRLKERRNLSSTLRDHNLDNFVTTSGNSVLISSYLSKGGRQYLDFNDFLDDPSVYRRCIQK